jgi:glucose/arabinose dehydrogenase
VRDGAVLPALFLDISTLVSTETERGLLGLAFHPQYAANRRFFVFYTALAGTIVVARYLVSETDPDLADPASVEVVLTIPHPGSSDHNAGMLAFGPRDGFLYVSTGNGGGVCVPSGNAQSSQFLLGKILRIDIDAQDPGLAYAAPPSNAFVGDAGYRPEIWRLGLRNPWRFAFDRLTGDLFIGDVGQDAYEEVDHQPGTLPDGSPHPGGLNFGWNVMEGPGC